MPYQRIRVSDIVQAVSITSGLTTMQLKSRQSRWDRAQARQAIYWLSRRLTLASMSEIGRRLRRDHSTVIKGAQAAHERLLRDGQYRAFVMEVLRHLRHRRAMRRLVDVREAMK